LKEQATKWEVAVAQLNAELARKLQILFPLLYRHIWSGIIFMPTPLVRHNLYADTHSFF
jgi:hypothetical protein